MAVKIPHGAIDFLMDSAIEQARLAAKAGEVPVGAVVALKDGTILAQAHNLVEAREDPSAHAEQLAIQAATRNLANWRLTDCILCVTLEPCTMCTGLIRLARIGTVAYGARDPRMGAMGSLFDLSQDSRLGPVPDVIYGIRENECGLLLKQFFQGVRTGAAEC